MVVVDVHSVCHYALLCVYFIKFIRALMNIFITNVLDENKNSDNNACRFFYTRLTDIIESPRLVEING